MPHLTVEYSANLDPVLRLPELIASLHDTAAGIDAFPLAGLRTRAERRDVYRIADGHPDNAFVHLVLRIAHGRPLDVRQAAGERIFATLCAHLAPLLARAPLAISFEIQEIDPVLNYKSGNIREYLARRGVQSAA
jgi:5-carboxymethyl-2-hydroxymuconate isomerase